MHLTIWKVNDVFEQSDFISIHLPLLAETYHCINNDTIKRMKNGVYIINTARGLLVNEEAVAGALKTGKLSGFATDVYEEEPIVVNSILLSCENFICTPYLAGESYTSYREIGNATAEGVLAILKGKKLKHRLV